MNPKKEPDKPKTERFVYVLIVPPAVTLPALSTDQGEVPAFTFSDFFQEWGFKRCLAPEVSLDESVILQAVAARLGFAPTAAPGFRLIMSSDEYSVCSSVLRKQLDGSLRTMNPLWASKVLGFFHAFMRAEKRLEEEADHQPAAAASNGVVS